MQSSTKKRTSKKAASLHRSQRSRPVPTTKAGSVADAAPEQRPEFGQTERAILDPEPDVKRRGRKTKYSKEFARIAKAMCKLGATDYDLAQ